MLAYPSCHNAKWKYKNNRHPIRFSGVPALMRFCCGLRQTTRQFSVYILSSDHGKGGVEGNVGDAGVKPTRGGAPSLVRKSVFGRVRPVEGGKSMDQKFRTLLLVDSRKGFGLPRARTF
jgi:hypothetical protein